MVARRSVVSETACTQTTISEDEHPPSMFPKQHNTQHANVTTRGKTISAPMASLLVLFFGSTIVAIFNRDGNLFFDTTSSSSTTTTATTIVKTTQQTEMQKIISDPVIIPIAAQEQENETTHATPAAIMDVLPNDPRCKLILDPNSSEIDEVGAEFGSDKEARSGHVVTSIPNV